MAKHLDAWLTAFVEAELRAAIAWKQQARKYPKVKIDPDERFSDDGSNFRSVAGRNQLPRDAKVQLLKVFSASDPAIVLISDGVSQLKAILFEDALSTLETGLTQKLDLDVEGDVISLNEVTVISTPYGPSEGFLQFSVHAIEYHHHLRKTIGNPAHISKHQSIASLIEETTRIRHWQSQDDQGAHDADISLADATETNDAAASQIDDRAITHIDSSPVAKSVQRSSPAATSTTPLKRGVLATQVATQVPAKRKSVGLSLSSDGIEVESGVNLDRPKGPAFAIDNHRSTAPVAKRSLLLGLLGKEKPNPSEQVVEASAAGGAHDDATPDEEAADSPEGHAVHVPEHTLPAPSVHDEVISSAAVRHAYARTPEPQSIGPRIPYGRRKVPANQQHLLDNRASWQPSLPGDQFPVPNVPIELLEQWNNAAFPVQPSHPVGAEVVHEVHDQPMSDAPENESEQSDDSSSSSSDEEVGPSQWPESPPQTRKAMLPPDSTFGSNTTGTQASPHKLPLRSPAKSTALSPNGTPSVIVKATQTSSNSDDMEMNVPRALPDPAAEHRKRRSEYFEAAQRREW